jgi:glycerol-3-phosphate dehydrogenase
LRRTIGSLQASYDLLVVGGGIYGAWVAYDAALRGLSVLIIEASDWGSGTSSASSKLIHGGLRYLEYGRLGLVHTALVERSRLLRLGPHRIHPLRFLVPIWRDSRMRPWQLSAGLLLYDLLSGVRGPDRHRRLGLGGIRQACPFLEGAALQNGFTYLDAGEDDARYCLEVLSGAVAAGACALNHCRMLRLLDGTGTSAEIRDEASGRTSTVQARVTVLATGPWTQELSHAARLPVQVRLNKGVHLVMPPLPGPNPAALLLTAQSDQRVFFLIPWYGATLLGTTDSDWQGDPREVRVENADVEYLLREVSRRCPGLGWRRADIRGAFAGLRTLQREAGRSATAATREWTLSEPRPGLLVPIGGKLTSARSDAGLIVDRACQLLSQKVPCATREQPLPWAVLEHAPWLAQTVARGMALGLDRELSETLANRHGRWTPRLHQLIQDDPRLGERIHPQVPMALAETLHAVQAEMACDLTDVLRRRVPALILARLSLAQLRRVADVVAQDLGWDHERALREAEAIWATQQDLAARLGLGPVPEAGEKER